jgi:DNA-binding transcriptional LysR family regulator
MELRHLRYFVGVAEDLHFGRAAARLGISQPPLSQQIRALEDELGVQLFERSSRKVMLTSAGTLFLREARETLAQAERAATIVRRAARGEIGELAIGFNASAPFVPSIARAIYDFRRAYPDVHLTLSELPETPLRAALSEKSIEIGFMRAFRPPAVSEGLVARLLLREGLVVAMRPDHPLAKQSKVSIHDLHRQPMIFYQPGLSGGFTEEISRLMRASNVVPVIAQDVREVSTLLGLVAAGIGITIIAQSLSALQSAGIAYRPFDEEGANSAMWVLHPEKGLSEPARRFLAAFDEVREEG